MDFSPDRLPPSLTPGRVRALLTLLGDENPGIVRTAREALTALGPGVTPALRDCLDGASLIMSLRIRDVLSRLEAPSLEDRFRRLSRQARAGRLNLEEALFTVARLGNPHLRPLPYRRMLDEMAREIRDRLPADDGEPTPGRVVHAVNEVVFSRHGFRGDREEYYRVENSYLHRVLERRRGIPLSLSCVVLLLARRLDLPFRGVALPTHFLLSYPVRDRRIFIDVFNRGALINRGQCREFLEQAGFSHTDAYLQPASNRRIVVRCLRNLAGAFRRARRPDRARTVNRLLKTFR